MTRARDRASADFNGEEIIIDADADTSITADTDDQIDIKVAGADDFKFTANTFHSLSGSSILIGGGSSRDVGGNGGNIVQIEGTDFPTSSMSLTCNANGTTAPTLRFAKSRGTSLGSSTVVQDDDELGVLVFAGADGTDVASQGAAIIAAVDGTPGGNDLPTRLVFKVAADGASSGTEHMRISANGRTDLGTGPQSNGAKLTLNYTSTTEGGLRCSDTVTSGTHTQIQFLRGGTQVGKIECANQASTAYVTSSDYRMKENVNYSWDATTKLKQLKPAEFTWKAEYDSNKTKVQGFLAHEVSDIVPEAVSGEKDAAEMQGIDQSKLVPLLVKTIQEQQAVIEDLKSRVTTLEG